MKKNVLQKHLAKDTSTRFDASSETVANALKEASALLSPPVLLATASSSKPGRKPYRIQLTASNTVFCECNGFRFRQRCRHMDQYRASVSVVNL